MRIGAVPPILSAENAGITLGLGARGSRKLLECHEVPPMSLLKRLLAGRLQQHDLMIDRSLIQTDLEIESSILRELALGVPELPESYQLSCFSIVLDQEEHNSPPAVQVRDCPLQ